MKLSRIYRGAPEGEKPTMNPWYIDFEIGGVRRQIKKGINRGKSIQARERLAKDLKAKIDKLIIESLQNPHINNNETLRYSLEWAFAEKSPRWAHKTQLDFRSILNYFLEISSKLGYADKPVKDFNRVKARTVFDTMVRDRKLGGHAYDKYKVTLFNLFRYLLDYEKILYNPCDFQSGIRKPKPKAKMLLSDDEWLLVQEHLKKENPGFLNYVMMIYYTFMRPIEIFKLTVRDVDLKRGEIRLPAKSAKDKEDRVVTIPKKLEPYLKSVKLPTVRPDFYLFGYYLIPSERIMAVKRDHATKLWNELVKKQLGIDSDLYWVKALGMKHAMESGVPVAAIKAQAGHSMDSQTFAYTGTDLKHLKDAIRNIGQDL